MTIKLKIDFVSDVSCPWCIFGLRGLEEGLARAKDTVSAEIVFQPFELNPDIRVGLDEAEAREVLTSGRYADVVREAEALWRSRGIAPSPPS